jgi:hypothetical protein
MKEFIKGISIDPEIRPLVQALNKLPGVKTFASCFGHPGERNAHKPMFSWVNFHVDKTKIVEYMKCCGNMTFSRWRIHNNLPGINCTVSFGIYPSESYSLDSPDIEVTKNKKTCMGSITIRHYDKRTKIRTININAITNHILETIKQYENLTNQ